MSFSAMPASAPIRDWHGGDAATRRLSIALTASLALHAVVLELLPGPWAWRPSVPAPSLVVTLRAAQSPPPAPARPTPPPAPVPAPPSPAVRAPLPKPPPAPTIVPIAPASAPAPAPRAVTSRAGLRPTSKRAIVARQHANEQRTERPRPVRRAQPLPMTPAAAPPSAAARPRATLPAPAVTRPAPARTPVTPDMLAQYGRDVSRRLSGYKEYPRLARVRGWQGVATLRLEVDRHGRLADASLQASSGHAVLDEAALAMVKNLGALPPPPAQLRGRAFAVVVRVAFRLEP